jgi:hypothetical protein
MKIKTSDLKELALDYVVGSLHGYLMNPATRSSAWIAYSTDWAQGGPIIEREKIEIFIRDEEWFAYSSRSTPEDFHGPTPLIAAMRCFVASKLGAEVEIHEELT